MRKMPFKTQKQNADNCRRVAECFMVFKNNSWKQRLCLRPRIYVCMMMTSYNWRKKVEFKLQLMAFRNKNILPCLTCQYDRGQCMHARHLNTLLRIVFLRMNCKNVDNHVTQFWTVLRQSTHWIQLRNVCTQHDKLTAFLVMIQNLNSKGAVEAIMPRFVYSSRYILHFTTQRPEFERLKPTLAILHWLTTFKTFFHVDFFPTKPVFPLPACSACFHV